MGRDTRRPYPPLISWLSSGRRRLSPGFLSLPSLSFSPGGDSILLLRPSTLVRWLTPGAGPPFTLTSPPLISVKSQDARFISRSGSPPLCLLHWSWICAAGSHYNAPGNKGGCSSEWCSAAAYNGEDTGNGPNVRDHSNFIFPHTD